MSETQSQSIWSRMSTSASLAYYGMRGGWAFGGSDKGLSLLKRGEEHPVYLNGKVYVLPDKKDAGKLPEEEDPAEKLWSHMRGCLWFTYRRDFEVIPDSGGITTDAGWGCTIRAGQMLLAQALTVHYLGQTWHEIPHLHTVEEDKEPLPATKAFNNIISWFADEQVAPYSIHRITQTGKFLCNKQIGNWFGPSTFSTVIQELVHRHSPLHKGKFMIYIAEDSSIYLEEVRKLRRSFNQPATVKGRSNLLPHLPQNVGMIDQRFPREYMEEGPDGEKEETVSILILVPLMAGTRNISAAYQQTILNFFRLPQCVGIIGARAKAAHYFMGCQGKDLMYLDPHMVQPKLPAEHNTNTAGRIRDTAVRMTPISQLDPCMTVGFYCATKVDFDGLIDYLENTIKNEPQSTLISVADQKPTGDCEWASDSDKSSKDDF